LDATGEITEYGLPIAFSVKGVGVLPRTSYFLAIFTSGELFETSLSIKDDCSTVLAKVFYFFLISLSK